ncbi:MAG: PucR family transcriptional regulator ligand-binding domain-containing protein [Microthrixaceae bacterium]|nr:PucR family transcriptional regulator ligand-binding domain-containing protein [Microthrixaceae bacterium]
MVTVDWLARQTDLGLTVVAGAQHTDRNILWAHAIELADPVPYLSGGELVMTTGINVGKTKAAQSEYVSRLVAAEAAALAFDTGTSFRQVPDGILAAADALGLPVLRVPASTPFIAITRAVIDAINADQLRSVQHTVELQQRLARETLRGGIPALVDALSKALGATTIALSTDGRLLAGAGPDTDRVAGLAAGLIGAKRGRAEPASRVVADGEGYCTLQALRAASVARGFLAVRSEWPLSNPERLLVAHAVSLISIELEKPSRVLDAEQRLRTAVTQALISRPGPAEPTVLRYFGFEPEADVLAVVLAGVGPALAAESQIQQVLHRDAAPFLMSSSREDIVVVIPATEMDRIPLLVDELRTRLGLPVVGGISGPGHLADVGLMTSQARNAARAPSGEPVRHYDELGVFEAILGDRTPDELTVLCDVLRPLEGHDLVPTLTEFLQNNGHLENAAAALGVHRHTMRNRLGRITELLGCSLESADTRAQLLLAIRAREINGG